MEKKFYVTAWKENRPKNASRWRSISRMSPKPLERQKVACLVLGRRDDNVFTSAVLIILNKGVTTKSITAAVKALSKSVKVTSGLLLFVSLVTRRQLEAQLKNLERILPFVHSIEPEILSVVQDTEFALHPEKYGMKLWATERTINDSWCYGLSPDIPWTFENERDADTWFRYYDDLRELIGDFVQSQYWDSIDDVRSRF